MRIERTAKLVASILARNRHPKFDWSHAAAIPLRFSHDNGSPTLPRHGVGKQRNDGREICYNICGDDLSVAPGFGIL